MATVQLKTVPTRSMLEYILSCPETEIEKIARLNPHLDKESIQKCVVSNFGLSLSTIEKNTEMKIDTLYHFRKELKNKTSFKRILRRIRKIVHLLGGIPGESMHKLTHMEAMN